MQVQYKNNYSLCSLLLGNRDLGCYCRVLTIHKLPLSLSSSQGSEHTLFHLSHSKMVGSSEVEQIFPDKNLWKR